MTTEGFRYDYFQTNEIVELSLFVKGVKEDSVEVYIGDRELSVKFEDGRVFRLAPLSQPIESTASKYTIKSMKMEFQLVKVVQGVQWKELVAEGQVDNTEETATEAPTQHKKDWNKIATEQDKEDDESKEANPDDFFKKLFANADDDVRKAMMKSYQESGGTTLSTNWSEVKKGEVKGSPPEGIERRK